MQKSPLFSIVVAVGILLASSSYVKSQSQVDPGISTHNYKHPNKAAMAKKNASVIRVSTLGTIERFGKLRGNNYSSSTPKYAVRPAALVIYKTYNIEKVAINPLTSDRNYKTVNTFSQSPISELASGTTSKDTIYPNQD